MLNSKYFLVLHTDRLEHVIDTLAVTLAQLFEARVISHVFNCRRPRGTCLVPLDKFLHKVQYFIRILTQSCHLHSLLIHLNLQLFLPFSLVVHFVSD